MSASALGTAPYTPPAIKLPPYKRLPTEIKLRILHYYVLFSFMEGSNIRHLGNSEQGRAVHDPLYTIDRSRFVFGRLMMMDAIWSVFKEINSPQRQKQEGLVFGMLDLVYRLAHKFAEEPVLRGSDREVRGFIHPYFDELGDRPPQRFEEKFRVQHRLIGRESDGPCYSCQKFGHAPH